MIHAWLDPMSENKSPQKLDKKHNEALVSDLFSQFYTPALQGRWIQPGQCGKGTSLCGEFYNVAMPHRHQAMANRLLLWLVALPTIVSFYATAFMVSVIASIFTLRPTWVRFAASAEGAGIQLASKFQK